MPHAHPSEACEILSQSLSNIDWFKKAYLKCFYRRLSDCRNYIFEYYFNLIIFQFTPATWLQQAASFFQRWRLWLFHFYDFDKNPNLYWIYHWWVTRVTEHFCSAEQINFEFIWKSELENIFEYDDFLNCWTLEYANISEHANF